MKKINTFLMIFLFTIIQIHSEKITFPILGFKTVPKTPIPIESEYDEKWFGEKTAFEYHHGIARIACILAEISYIVIEDYSDNVIIETYRRLGVKDEDVYFQYDLNYKNEYGNDQTGFTFAVKKIKSSLGEKNLVFVVYRGTPLNANEWISNLNVSDTNKCAETFHEGFKISMERTLPYFWQFLKDKNLLENLDDTFFLVTGHSRGASIANLFAAYLAGIDKIDKKKVYAYTFGTPNVTTSDSAHDEKFGYIWNIEGEEDLVQSVPPERLTWQYKKFGHTKILVSRYKVSEEKYNEMYDKMNEIFKRLLLRDYEPFRLGPFFPSLIARLLVNLEPTVDEYYGTVRGVRKKGEKIFWIIFPEKKKKKKEKPEQTEYIETTKTIDRIIFACQDMHCCEAYLAWMMAFEEDEVFSTVESSQLIFKGSENVEIFDKNGRSLAKITDGYSEYSKQHVPIGTFSLFGKTVVSLPSTEDFTVIMEKDSLFPTPFSVRIEHFDERGVLKELFPKQKFSSRFGKSYTFQAGKSTLENNQIFAEKNEGKHVRTGWEFYVAPEISLSTKKELTFGINLGTRNIHAIAQFTPKIISDNQDFSVGIGSQINLFDRIYFDAGFLWNFIWNNLKYSDLADSLTEEISQEPSIQLSFTYKPIHRVQIFAGVEFWDFCKFRAGVRL